MNITSADYHIPRYSGDAAALQQAIDRCWVFDGGEVVVPAGYGREAVCIEIAAVTG